MNYENHPLYPTLSSPPTPAQAKAGPQVIFLVLFLVNNYHFTSSFLKKIDLLVSIST